MANIFRKKDAYIDRVNRSTFDLSFVNNLTMKFGAITPVCLLPASFGDSFQINARFNLQLLPTVCPIQTQLYVRLHFVYVRPHFFCFLANSMPFSVTRPAPLLCFSIHPAYLKSNCLSSHHHNLKPEQRRYVPR